MAILQIPTAVPMTGSFFHITTPGLSIGEVIAPGHFGELHTSETAAQRLADPNGEHLRERIRLAEFSSKPSRMKSIFVWETLSDARNFRDTFRPGSAIYRVTFADPSAPAHRVCATSFRMPRASESMLRPEFLARQFWAYPPLTSENNEVFAESAVKIVAIEDPGTAAVATPAAP
jgi:hypothetical protein